jgi:hypothetical protein
MLVIAWKVWNFNYYIVEDYDVDVRNINNGVVDIRNNVVDKCCKQSKT